jgi:hypothetical protein
VPIKYERRCSIEVRSEKRTNVISSERIVLYCDSEASAHTHHAIVRSCSHSSAFYQHVTPSHDQNESLEWKDTSATKCRKTIDNGFFRHSICNFQKICGILFSFYLCARHQTKCPIHVTALVTYNFDCHSLPDIILLNSPFLCLTFGASCYCIGVRGFPLLFACTLSAAFFRTMIHEPGAWRRHVKENTVEFFF